MDETVQILLISAVVFLAVLALIPPTLGLALRAGFVDAPGGRKQHKEPIPPVGGLVIFPVYMIAGLFSGVSMISVWPLYAGLLLILIVGAVDDYRHIQPRIKFTAQVLAALIIVVFGQAQLHHLGNIFGFGRLWLGFMAIPFSVTAVVLLMNAINLMDGLDGLAGGKGLIVLFWLALACAASGHLAALGMILPLMAALAGFLFYNARHLLRARAAVFLGDSGSMALGLVIAWFAIGLTQEPHDVLPPIAIAWIVALPIVDICAQFYRRVREGRHPFAPDRGHFHHHFIHAGIPTARATAMILFLVFIFGAIGFSSLFPGLPEWVLTALWIVLLFTHMVFSRYPRTYIDFLTRRFSKASSS
jgi:UDP-GlcNAc:undecaprenyl-phosphate GlcNAc-1-phosphate transferase